VRRVGVAVAGAVVTLVVSGGPALAQYPPSKPPPTSPGGNDPSVAFTGTNIRPGLIILVGLAVVGTMLLLIGRRPRVRASH
jgi:hypothetical protein